MEFIVQFGSSWTCLVLLGSATLLSSSGNLCLSLDVEDDEEVRSFHLYEIETNTLWKDLFICFYGFCFQFGAGISIGAVWLESEGYVDLIIICYYAWFGYFLWCWYLASDYPSSFYLIKQYNPWIYDCILVLLYVPVILCLVIVDMEVVLVILFYLEVIFWGLSYSGLPQHDKLFRSAHIGWEERSGILGLLKSLLVSFEERNLLDFKTIWNKKRRSYFYLSFFFLKKKFILCI